MKVTFHYPDEFVAELAAEPGQVERRIVRVSVAYRTPAGQPYTEVALVAAALVAGQLVQLRHALGESLRGMEEYAKLTAQAQAERRSLEGQLAKLGLQVRAGLLEE